MVKLLVLMIIAVEVSAMVHTYPHARHAFSCSSHHLSMDTIARARTGLYMYSTSSRGCRRHQRMTSFRLHFDATTTTALESASVAGGLYLLLQLVVYWRMQFVAAGLVGGIPTGSNIVELDAVDGKNVFYLPKDSFYTAIMTSGDDKVDYDASKRMEKQRMNEQLILESIGKANSGNVNIQGRIRSRTQDVPGRSSDCVISVGAMKRSVRKDAQNPNNAKVELINEAYRMLRPGGLFVFLEPDDDRNLIDLVYKVFPRSIAPTSVTSGRQQQRKTESTALVVDSDKGTDTVTLDSSQTVVTVDNRRRKKSSRVLSSYDRNTSQSSEGIGMDNVGDALVVDSDASLSGSVEDSTVENNRARPGVSFQAISTLGLFTYVAGIAVKP